MLRRMRVRVYLDQELAGAAQRLADNRGISLTKALNAALREGINLLTSPARERKLFQTEIVDLGPCRFSNVDNIAEILSATESDPFK